MYSNNFLLACKPSDFYNLWQVESRSRTVTLFTMSWHRRNNLWRRLTSGLLLVAYVATCAGVVPFPASVFTRKGGQPFLCPYSASKGALATLTRNVARSVVKNRIRVNGLNLGWMDTPGEDTIQKRFHQATSDWLDKAEATQPFGRLIKPDEAARAVAFLLSDRSGLMTGSIVDFDQTIVGTGT